MLNDRIISISTGESRKSVSWKRQTLLISELYEKLRIPVRSAETAEQYMQMKKPQQDELKDVGGFVGGTLNGMRRKSGAVSGRDILTLDLDNIQAGCTDDILRRADALGCGYAVYSTRKHSAYAPRLRIIIPIDRTVSADEYEPICRKLAEIIGMDFADPTTFEPSRLMYWPSVCSDGEYVFTYADKPMLSADGMLALYPDWHDISGWPRNAKETVLKKPGAKQSDPQSKEGVVGAFCRVYDIPSAIDTFLPGVYEPTDGYSDRYTYAGGSTTGGAVLYDNEKFLYSHHATDPCSGRLVNAFDLVRLNLYGEADDEAKEGTPTGKLPSYKEMIKLALNDKAVSSLMLKEDFEDAALPQQNIEWAQLLTRTERGYEKTYRNVEILLENHPLLKDRIKYNAFADSIIGIAPLPWGSRSGEEGEFVWSDSDDSGLRVFIEQTLKFRASDIINTALSDHFAKHSYNPVTDYLNGLEWDGIARLDNLFTDYLGAPSNAYTREITRKSMVGAVMRAFDPGCKYDTMLVLISEKEGIGKSTLLYKLSRGWFNDNLISFEGNKASEALQGSWLIEVAEMHALAKTDVNRIKQFLSQRDDIYRRAYGRRTEWHPRRCVFFGTGNNADFIEDSTGGRRFWPIDVGGEKPNKSVFKDLDDETDQIWAEAMFRYRLGESLILSPEVEKQAAEIRDEHRSLDPRYGAILDFVEKEVPEDWLDWSTDKRIMFWGAELKGEQKTVQRKTISAPEIWCELFLQPLGKLTKTEAASINNVLKSIPGWERKGAGYVGPARRSVRYYARKGG